MENEVNKKNRNGHSYNKYPQCVAADDENESTSSNKEIQVSL